MVPSSQTTTATKPLPLPSSPTILSLSLECRGKCKILRSLHSQLFFPRLLEVETQQRNARERRDVTAVARGGGQRRNAECLIKAVRMSGEVTNWLSAALCSTLYPLSPPKKKKNGSRTLTFVPFFVLLTLPGHTRLTLQQRRTEKLAGDGVEARFTPPISATKSVKLVFLSFFFF